MNKIKFDKGITLISLLLTIIILIILSAVAIRSFIGDEGIISSTEVAVEDYRIMQYKEQIEQIVQSTIVIYATMGKEVGLDEISDSLRSEGSTWIITTSVSWDQSINNPDILVTTIEGYTFQVFYDNIYGIVYVEYIGLSKNGEFPNLTASFNNFKIETNAIIQNGTITKIEVMYGGIIKDITNLKKYEVEKEKMGWYKIKTQASNGNLRYAWVKTNVISDKLMIPIITATPANPDGKENWYITKPSISIKTENNQNAKEIHYNIIGSINESNIINANEQVNIAMTECGIIKITAWTEDGIGGRSKEISEIIKFDNIKPTVTATIEANLIGENSWIKSNAEIKVKIEDEVGIIDGYEYEVLDKNFNKIKELTYVEDENRTIKVETDGEYVIKITGMDRAGNKSEMPAVLTVKKDTTPPEIGQPILDNNSITDTEFTVSIAAKDKCSGIDRYEFYVNGKLFDTKNTGVCKINKLQAQTEYEVYVIVYDKAGWSEQSMYISAITKNDGYANGGNNENNGDGNNGDNGNNSGDDGDKENNNNGGNVEVDGDKVIIGGVENTKTELIGKYVNYKPEGQTYNETIKIESTSQTYNFEPENLLWRIWTFDEDKMYLISSTATNSKLTLKGVWRI